MSTFKGFQTVDTGSAPLNLSTWYAAFSEGWDPVVKLTPRQFFELSECFKDPPRCMGPNVFLIPVPVQIVEAD